MSSLPGAGRPQWCHNAGHRRKPFALRSHGLDARDPDAAFPGEHAQDRDRRRFRHAEAAVKKFNGQEMDGRMLKVELAKSGGAGGSGGYRSGGGRGARY